MSLFSLLMSAFFGLLTAGMGIVTILIGTDTILLVSAQQFFDTALGKAILFCLGGLLFCVAIYFAFLFYRGRAQASRFSQDGEWGKVELSPYALRELISGIMRDEIGIERFQVRLQHIGDGIAIRISTALSLEEKVAEVGRKIQETLTRHVMERTGVEVREVSVLVNSISGRDDDETGAIGESDSDAD
jgi:uncharacterized alkaline shock family protein YloU